MWDLVGNLEDRFSQNEAHINQARHGSLVGSVSARMQAVPRSILVSGTFFQGKTFPLPLIQKS